MDMWQENKANRIAAIATQPGARELRTNNIRTSDRNKQVEAGYRPWPQNGAVNTPADNVKSCKELSLILD